jgi:RNA polymerase sigma-70 factor (ECF subfamily)
MHVSSGTVRFGAEDQARAFEVLIRPLLEGAFGLAYSMLRDRGAAEDAVQESAVKAWRGIEHLRRDVSPQPWFFAIVANQCRDVRRVRRLPVIGLGDAPEPIQGDHADRVVDDLDLERALALLAPEQSALLFLRFNLDMPPSQIAAVLRWRVGTVKSRLHRTLRKLEAELAPTPLERPQ